MAARTFRAPYVLGAGTVLSAAPAFLFAVGAQEARTPVPPPDLRAGIGRSIGPPGTEVRSLVLAPSDPQRLYLGTATGHVYASHDAAESWEELPADFGHESVVDNLLVHPQDADTLFAAFWTAAGSGGLRRSQDGGRSWERLDVPASPSLRAVAMAPSDPDRLYVGGIGGVWRSDDGGSSWRNINGVGLASEFIESLAVDPRDPEHVYAGTWRQVYRTRDGGDHWARIYAGMAVDRDIFSLAISPHDPETVLAGTCNFLYCSYDAGGSWGERRRGLARTHNRVHTIVHDPTDADVLYAGTRGALYRSADGGTSWDPLLGNVSVSALALDSKRQRLYVGTEERGVLVGTPEGDFSERNEGIGGARVVAFDSLPGSPQVLFAARADGATRSTLHVSTDSGTSWKPLGATAATRGIDIVRAQRHPLNRVLVVAAGEWWSVGPGGRWVAVPAPPGTTAAVEIADELEGAVVAATDAGLYAAPAAELTGSDGTAAAFDDEDAGPWQPLWQGGPLRTLAIAGRRLLAAGEGEVLNARFAAAPGGGLALQAPRTSPFDDVVTAVALHPTEPRSAYLATSTAVFTSVDGGATWSPMPMPWPAAQIRGLAVDPSDDDQLLVLDYRGAIYRAHAGGAHWLILDQDAGLHRAWSFHVTGDAPGLALVATQGHGLRVVGVNPLWTAPPVPAAGNGRQ